MKWSIPERIIERGRAYANSGRVVSIEADKKMMIWRGEVVGSEIYDVELDGTAKEMDFCTCPYWKDHGYCKHTVAVELALKKVGLSRIIEKNPSIEQYEIKKKSFGQLLNEKFINYQGNELFSSPNKETIKIEAYLQAIPSNRPAHENDLLGVWLKIGFESAGRRMYIVQDVQNFLNAYEEQKGYDLGGNRPNFHLVHEAFDIATQELLEILITYYHSQSILQYEVVGSPSMNGKFNRYILVTPENSLEIVEALRNQKMNYFVMNDGYNRNLYFNQFVLPLSFDLKVDRKGCRLTVTRKPDLYFSNYRWVVIENQIYEMNHEQNNIYSIFNELYKRFSDDEIVFEEEEKQELFSYVLPYLKKIGEVHEDQDIKEQVVIEPIVTEFFFSYEGNSLKLLVDFCYGKYRYSTDKSRESKVDHADCVVIREQRAEAKVTDYVLSQDFNLQKDSYQKRMVKSQDIFKFFKKQLPQFQKLGSVHLDSVLEAMMLDAEKYQPKISIAENDSWLDIRFDISGIPENEVDKVLESLMNQAPYHVFANGQILPLEKEIFQETSQALQKLRQDMRIQDGVATVPRYQGLQLKQTFDGIEGAEFDGRFMELVNDLVSPESYPVTLPTELNAKLRKYQFKGFQWLKMLSHYQLGGILADEMGLGKTLQTIAFLLSEKEEGNFTRQALIVAPASLIYNWQMEIQKFAPSLNVTVIAGSKAQRKELILGAKPTEILVSSYAGVRGDKELYNERSMDYLVLDEAQMVKNSASKTFHAIKEIKATHRFALSGTPVENKLEELWSLFELLMPGFFPPKKIFLHMKIEEIARNIQPFVLRREKKEVLKDLPEKIETNLYSVLTEEQKKIYLAQLKQIQDNIGIMNHEEFQKNRISILASLTRLRQICCDPSLFVEGYQGGSGKVEQVKEILRTAKENNRRVLLFSQFTSMLSKLEDELATIGLATFYLHGETPPKQRIEMVEHFNQGEKDVFLISLKAGGTGLNLTGADTVVLFDLWWNPAVEEQAASRAHRMGQKKVVDVWRLIAEGTIEEKMYDLQQEKKELFQKVLQADDKESLNRLTEEDIREILSMGEGLS